MRDSTAFDVFVRTLRAVPAEALFWTAGLVGVASMDPQGGTLVNLCVIEQLGLPCPGDGLGRSIAHLARGQLAASWTAHPLGGPVVGVLLYHVGTLCRRARPRATGAHLETR
jgi:hypothetical protein